MRSTAVNLLQSLLPGVARVEKNLEFLKTNVGNLDGLVHGFPRGAITEIFGPPSSGRTTLLHTFLASATRNGEYCALVDASGNFDPESAEKAGLDLSRMFWVKCNRSNDKVQMEQALKCADLLLHGGGWGVVVLDFGDISPLWLRRLPISYWYRFRRVIEPTPTVLVVLEQEPFVRACASLALELQPAQPNWAGAHADFRILESAEVRIALKKPVVRNTAVFSAQTLEKVG